MPSRFYFNLTNGAEVVRDPDGIELADVDSALLYAAKAIEELRAEDPLSAESWQGWNLEIVDVSGRTIHILPLDGPPSEPSSRQ